MSDDANNVLPSGYETLEPFVADWAIPSLAGRAARRDTCTVEERLAFYEATRPIVAQALAELDTKALDEFNEREQRLMALLLSYAQVAMTVEVRQEGEAAHARDRKHMVITHEPQGLRGAAR